MPHHDSEENATGSIYDQVAKESKDSTASTHPMHEEDNKVSSGGGHAGSATKATAEDHKATPGIQISQNLGEPASKEELKKRSEELNK